VVFRHRGGQERDFVQANWPERNIVHSRLPGTRRVAKGILLAQHNEYAEKIFSDEGQHNGLYWKAVDGAPESPIGPLVAAAVAEDYSKSQGDAPTRYQGYYFHILTRQGKNGPSGAKSYVINGKMTGGFAFVAYSAEYRSSGVMTFIVNEDGVVFEKDLGKKTGVVAKNMKEYNPNSSWQKAEEQQEETASDQHSK
jgi:hypothetical protein